MRLFQVEMKPLGREDRQIPIPLKKWIESNWWLTAVDIWCVTDKIYGFILTSHLNMEHMNTRRVPHFGNIQVSAASVRRRSNLKFFDSADWAMQKEDHQIVEPHDPHVQVPIETLDQVINPVAKQSPLF